MAILSNGKFYGFLCSAKETGQKLANGAKEYVEDFISGFAGHGWKIWEYVKGKWMLEIDSIRVRGQFTVFEMLISKVRAIIGAQAITQGCGKIKKVELSEDETAFLITLEDADMSFMEHDFIRCQEFTGSQKVYHVEIESVVDGVIRVLKSEFDVNTSGLVLNPPTLGDEIVQFGNSSYEEKYAGRHSAIYMHADEGMQPAIDVLDRIYSKDWSDCLRVRVGGDIPGGDKLKGFYCVNGMIKGTDDSSHVTYCIYPDGTAEFGDGSTLFRPDKSGYIAGGAISWKWDDIRGNYTCTMGDVILTWENLSDEVKGNLKGDSGKDANLLPWVKDWNSKGTMIGKEYVVSPKIFSGTEDLTTGKLTGVALGRDFPTENGTKTGLFAYKNNQLTFELNAETGDATFSGTVYTDSGRLGGLKIHGDSLTNEGFDNDAYIIMRNDKTKTFAGIGGNLLPATSGGISAVARFENNRRVTGSYAPSNIALFLEASGSDGDNIALSVSKGRMDVPGLLMGGRIIIVNNSITMPYKYGPWKNYRISRPDDRGFVIEHNLGHSRYYVIATLCDVGTRGDMGFTGLIDVFEINNNYFKVFVGARDGSAWVKGFAFSIIGDNR